MIKLDHSFTTSENNSRICVFVKDPQRAFKDQIQDLDVPTIAKVIGFDKLKRNFKQFKDKRTLLKQYDGFLADLRIYKLLPECLGKEFYDKKKFPCPIKLHGFEPKQLQEQLNSATKATYFTLGNGPNYSVRIGRTNQDAKHVARKSQLALAQILAFTTVHDDIKFEKVVSVSLKTSSSPELPVYNHLAKEDLNAFK